jgi:hypothetical protein
MRARRGRHIGAVRPAAFEAFQRPDVTALEALVRLDAHDARRAAAFFALGTGENFRLF